MAASFRALLSTLERLRRKVKSKQQKRERQYKIKSKQRKKGGGRTGSTTSEFREEKTCNLIGPKIIITDQSACCCIEEAPSEPSSYRFLTESRLYKIKSKQRKKGGGRTGSTTSDFQKREGSLSAARTGQRAVGKIQFFNVSQLAQIWR